MNELNFHPIYADPWKPSEPGSTLIGTIFEVGEKVLRKDAVPYAILVDDDGVMKEVLLGSASLNCLYCTGELKEGRRLAIRYDGESGVIENAGNFMKMFSFILWDENGKELDITKALKEVKGSIPQTSEMEHRQSSSKPFSSEPETSGSSVGFEDIPSAADSIESKVRKGK